jgi:hypothetical protein
MQTSCSSRTARLDSEGRSSSCQHSDHLFRTSAALCSLLRATYGTMMTLHRRSSKTFRMGSWTSWTITRGISRWRLALSIGILTKIAFGDSLARRNAGCNRNQLVMVRGSHWGECQGSAMSSRRSLLSSQLECLFLFSTPNSLSHHNHLASSNN